MKKLVLAVIVALVACGGGGNPDAPVTGGPSADVCPYVAAHRDATRGPDVATACPEQ